MRSQPNDVADDYQKAGQAQQMLRDAIEVLPEGIVFLDAEGRYVMWNERYAEIYAKSADLFRPGVKLADTLRIGVERGDYPEAIGREEDWLTERLALLDNPGMRHEQWLASGRCIMVEERKTADGGTIGLRVDITEMKRREESFRLLFEGNPAPMFVYDPETETVRSFNDAARGHFGLDDDEIHDLPAATLFTEDEWPQARRALAGKTPARDRIWRQRDASGNPLESILFTRETDYAGAPGLIVCVFDVTERRRAEAKLAHMARHDALTGLANRTQCRAELGARLRDPEASVALLVVDLDHFKIVNDTHGHLVGDALLEHVAARMVATMPSGSLAARLGGDEFAVVLPAGLAMPDVVTAAVGIVAAMREPFVIEDHRILIGATIGVAAAPLHAGDAETLFRFADLALYSAKAEQRGTVVLFEPEMDTAARERHAMESDLREAVRMGGLEVHYQPLIDLQSGRTQGYEALVRWNHPVRGQIGPDQFIPLAEETGLIDLIGQFVLNTACAEAATWQNGEIVAVNVSPVQFRNANLLRVVTQALAASQLPPERLEIELTEAVLIEKAPQVAATMNSLRKLGVGISMDDFGTGYSSLSYLLNYPFTKIKIDKSFVSSLDSKPDSQAIVKAIIGLGDSLGMTVTAEGIEQGAVLDYLKSEGCGQGQGYLFGAAQPAANIPATELPALSRRTKAA